MIRSFAAMLLLSLVQPVSSVAAKPAGNAPTARDLDAFRQGLHALIKQATPSEAEEASESRSQGAEHASLRAIRVVCSKDTPAAHRSAICHPNSPF